MTELTELTELERIANEEARHAHREALEKADVRIAELEAKANDRAYRIEVLERDRNAEIHEARARIAELEEVQRATGFVHSMADRAHDDAWNAAIEAAYGGISGASPWGFTQSKALEIVRALRKGGEDE